MPIDDELVKMADHSDDVGAATDFEQKVCKAKSMAGVGRKRALQKYFRELSGETSSRSKEDIVLKVIWKFATEAAAKKD